MAVITFQAALDRLVSSGVALADADPAGADWEGWFWESETLMMSTPDRAERAAVMDATEMVMHLNESLGER